MSDAEKSRRESLRGGASDSKAGASRHERGQRRSLVASENFPSSSSGRPKERLRRLVQGDDPPTAPMRLVERLEASPFGIPKPVQKIQEDKAAEDARQTIDFTLRLAETMFRFGAGSLEVETSIVAVTAAFGLRHIEVDITNQLVSVNYAPQNATPIMLLRVVRSWTNNFAGLILVHQLVTDIVSGKTDRTSAERRLSSILGKPKPYPRWMVTTSAGLFAACVVAVIGGGLLGAAVAGLSAVLASLISRVLSKWKVPDFFVTTAATATVTSLALGFWALHFPIEPAAVVTGGVLLFLPSGRLVSAVQDAINGFPVTAAGRFLSAFLTFGAVVSGIGMASVLGVRLGFNSGGAVQEMFSSTLPFTLIFPLILIATMLSGIVEQTLPRLLLPIAVTGLIGYGVFVALIALHVGPRLSPAIAATVVGVVSRLLGLWLDAPQLVVAVPSILFLLTGLSIFRSMFHLTVDDGLSLAGVVGLFNSLAVILGIAAGVVLGDSLARPLLRRYQPNAERRGKRR